MRAAWGGLEGEALEKAVAPYNPAAHLEWTLQVPIAIAHGRNDRAVPLEKNALALAHQVGERAHLFLTDDEHSTQAFGLYETPLFRQLLEKGK